MNPWFRKSVAGRPVGNRAWKPHYVTPAGSEKKIKRTPMLELLDRDTGIRYALKTINQSAAELFRQQLELGNLGQLNISVVPATMGDRQYQAVVVHSEKKGDVPVFEIGSVFGVTNRFVDIVKSKLDGVQSKRQATAFVAAAANKIGVTFGQLLGRTEPDQPGSPFPEYEESQYGSRFYMCQQAIREAYESTLAGLAS